MKCGCCQCGGWPWASYAQQLRHELAVPVWQEDTHFQHSINIHCDLEQRHFNCMIFMVFFYKPSILSQSQLDDSLELDFCFPQWKNICDIIKYVTFSELLSGGDWAAELLILFFNHFNLNLHQICSCCKQAALNMQEWPAVTAHRKSQQQWNHSLFYCNHSYIGNIRPLSSANAWSTDVFFPSSFAFGATGKMWLPQKYCPALQTTK